MSEFEPVIPLPSDIANYPERPKLIDIMGPGSSPEPQTMIPAVLPPTRRPGPSLDTNSVGRSC